MLLMMFGVGCLTGLIGSLVPIFADLSSADDQFHHQVELLKQYLVARNVPAGMSRHSHIYMHAIYLMRCTLTPSLSIYESHIIVTVMTRYRFIGEDYGSVGFALESTTRSRRAQVVV